MHARSIGREIGTALAVLAIYILTLLLPLHQAAGLQRDLSQLGYQSSATWSICAAAAQDSGDRDGDAAPIHCPAAGIGKHEFAGPLPVAANIHSIAAVAPVRYDAASHTVKQHKRGHVAQPRAPPAAA